LTDMEWLEFRIDDVKEITWSKDMFSRLDLQRNSKKFLKSLVESHASSKDVDSIFDDFVPGKGLGMIFNLHGPPGVGKTLTAEATSEVTQSPLYVVGTGDLGTGPSDLDRNLRRVFTLANRWKAVVLIDEADVFLEKRDLRDMVRNAMVAVFLRQLEYYPGILFLTTNRITVFDDAMLSRIHLSLFYSPLDNTARARLWKSFLAKTNMSEAQQDYIKRNNLANLSALPLNGREIKNIVKLSTAVANHENREVKLTDIQLVIKLQKRDKALNGRLSSDSLLKIPLAILFSAAVLVWLISNYRT